MLLVGAVLALVLTAWQLWTPLPAQAQDGGPQQQEIDATPPSVLSIASKKSTAPNATTRLNPPYIIGQDILLVVTFDEPVTVTGAPQLSLTIGDSVRAATFKSVEQGAVTFEYLVAEGDEDKDGISVAADALSLNGGTIRDAAGNHALLNHPAPEDIYDYQVDGVRPFVENIAITSDPGSDDTYGVGDMIEVTVTFNEEVTIFSTVDRSVSPPRFVDPGLEVDIGDEAKWAEYKYRGISVSQAVFQYTVQAGDVDANGISIGANKLALNGATIMDGSGNIPISGVLWDFPQTQHAVLPHAAIPEDAGHKVGLTLSGAANIAIAEDGSFPEWVLELGPWDSLPATYSVVGTEADVTWSLTGHDGHLFRLTGSGDKVKSLEFNSSQPESDGLLDYDNPKDSDGNGIYEVTMQASDGVSSATEHLLIFLFDIPLHTDEVPVILGSAQVGKTLKADPSGVSPWALGAAPTYQWIRSDGATDTEISGATDLSYTLTNEDLGKTVKVRMDMVLHSRMLEIPGTDARVGKHPSRTSADTAAVVAATADSMVNSPATGSPTIIGTPEPGRTLRVDVSGIADADGLTNVSYRYQWFSNDGTGDADYLVYFPDSDDVVRGWDGLRGMEDHFFLNQTARDKTFGVRVTFLDDAGNWEILTSGPTPPVRTLPNSPATGKPTINGTARLGETLAADVSGIRDANGLPAPARGPRWYSSPRFRYQWIRGDGATDSAIDGADSSNYTLVGADVGHTVKVRVSFTDGSGYAETLISAATPVVSDTTALQQQGAPNRAPTVSDAISDATIVNESGTHEVSLSGVFDDPDNDALIITATSSDEARATVSVASDQTSLTVTARSRGTTTIKVAANDGNGATVQDTFIVTVKAAPVVAQPLGDVTGLEIDTTREVPLFGAFSDGDVLTITAASSADAVATVSAAADRSKLTLTGVSEGTATISVTAQDSDGNRVSDDFEVEVVKRFASLIPQMYQWRNDPQWVNQKQHTDRWDRALLAFGETVADTSLTPMPASEAQSYADTDWGERWVPVAAALWEIEAAEQRQQQAPSNQAPTVSSVVADGTIINESETKQVSLSGVFSDGDNDALTVTAASSDEAVATVSVAADYSSLTVSAQARGTATITVTASDGNGGAVQDTFTIAVKAAPTVVSALADLTSLEEGATQDVPLAGVFSDADGDSVTITAASSNDAIATVTVDAGGSTLTLTGMAEGTATITVTAQDSDGNRVSDEFTAPVARKYAALIAQMYQWRNGPEAQQYGKPHTDRWDRALLAFGETVADASITPMTAAEAQALADQDWGTRWVPVAKALKEIEAGGQQDQQQQQQSPLNRAPTVASALADATIVNESGTHQVSLSGVFTDADNDSLSVTSASSDDAKATVSVAADYSSLTVTAKARGTAAITVTAKDGNGGTVQDTFTVTVKAAPTVALAPSDLSGLEAGATRDVSLSGVFSDADGDALTVTAASGNTGVAKVTVAAGYSSLTVTGVAEGSATITVTAQDADGNRVSHEFDVAVTPPPQQQGQGPANQSPTVSSAIADATITSESSTHQVSLSGVFTDPDNDSLTITAAASDEAAATVSVAADYSSLTVIAQARGTATITVTADDGNGGTVSDAFTVRVKAAPVVATAIADLSGLEEGSTRDVSLSGVFSDADGDALTITAASSNDAIATVTVAADGSMLTLSGVAEGTATITVTARDTDGNTVSDDFSVSVEPEQDPPPEDDPSTGAPTVATPLPDISLEGPEHKEIDLSAVFHDPDGDELTFRAVSSKYSVATMWVDGSTLTVVGTGTGTATITVTAEDPDGNTVSDSFDVTVSPAS